MSPPGRVRLAIAFLVSVASCGGPVAKIVGTVRSSGGELGTFDFTPDRCVSRRDLDALDLTSSKDPSVVLRVAHPTWKDSEVVVVSNARAPSGPKEIAFARSASCAMHVGYHEEGSVDRGVGLRIDCATPEGGRVSGVVGAGSCR